MKLTVNSVNGTGPRDLELTTDPETLNFRDMCFHLTTNDEGHLAITLDTLEYDMENYPDANKARRFKGIITSINIETEVEEIPIPDEGTTEDN